MKSIFNHPFLLLIKKPRMAINIINQENSLFSASIITFLIVIGAEMYSSVFLPGRSISLTIMIKHYIMLNLFFLFFPWIIYIMGKLLKGEAELRKIILSFYWANSVRLWLLLFGIPIFIANCLNPEMIENCFINNTILTDIWIGLEIVLSIWSIVVFVIMLSEIQKFTLLKSILNIIIGTIIIVLPIGILMGIILIVDFAK